jgi:hypothetical protein
MSEILVMLNHHSCTDECLDFALTHTDRAEWILTFVNHHIFLSKGDNKGFLQSVGFEYNDNKAIIHFEPNQASGYRALPMTLELTITPAPASTPAPAVCWCVLSDSRFFKRWYRIQSLN